MPRCHMCDHLDAAVKALTVERDRLKAQIERQAAYHDAEIEARRKLTVETVRYYRDRIRKLRGGAS